MKKAVYIYAALFAPLVLFAEVKVDAERVYVHDDGTDGTLSFSHGNPTLRVKLENESDTARTLRISLPLVDKPFNTRGHSAFVSTMRINAKLDIAAHEQTDFDIPVPMVGRLGLNLIPIDGDEIISDSSGDGIDSSALRTGGYSGNVPWKALCQPPQQKNENTPENCMPPLRIIATANSLRFGIGKAFGDKAIVETPDFAAFHRWQDISVYDGLVIAAVDWPQLPDKFKSLLPDWVAAGGILCKAGTAAPKLPEGLYGLGRIVAIPVDSPDLADFASCVHRAAARHDISMSRLECDVKASDAMQALRGETPLMLILAILLAFCIIAGPVLIAVLARTNHRIGLLWMFPVLAIAFTLAVMGVIVYEKGVYPELRQFAHKVVDENAGRVVTVVDSIILAPFPLMDEVHIDAKDSVVQYFSGEASLFGDSVDYTGDEFVFRGGWGPTLWPVLFRTVTVEALAANGESRPMIRVPLSGRLQEHQVSATEERRSAQ